MSALLVALLLTYRIESATEATAMLHARRIDAVAEPLQRELRLPASGTLDVAEGLWELTLTSDGVWAQAVVVRAKEGVTIDALPAAKLRARIGGAMAAPSELNVILTPATPQLRGGNLRADIVCPVREREILCTVPAGAWDIRLTPAGFIPQFRWNVRLPARQTTRIDAIPLVKGASLIGTVERADGEAVAAGTSVTLVPSAIATEDAQAVTLRATPNAKGFFQFAAVPAGAYFISASAKPLISQTREVIVVAIDTVELDAPLLLDLPKRVRVTITPPLDPDGKPWRISLSRRRDGVENHYDMYALSAANEEGTWRESTLRDGHYSLGVQRGDGSTWASVDFDLGAADLDLKVKTTAVRVEGTVKFGDDPLAARLHFGGEYASEKQVLQSGDDGTFSGVIPADDDDEWEVFIEADAPVMRRTLENVRGKREGKDEEERLVFDIVIPRIVVTGIVVEADGTPAPGAIINVHGEGPYEQHVGEEDGTFQINGLPPGSYTFHADGRDGTSEKVMVQVTDAGAPPLRLVVREDVELRGRVVTASGTPVVGAMISGVAREPQATLGASGRTNEAGAFTIPLAANTKLFDAIIAPPGFATIVRRIVVQPGKMLEIRAEQNGGTLLCEFPPEENIVTLLHGGATFSVMHLMDVKGVHTPTLPAMEPGEYTLCIQQRCTSGVLAPHGTLKLRL